MPLVSSIGRGNKNDSAIKDRVITRSSSISKEVKTSPSAIKGKTKSIIVDLQNSKIEEKKAMENMAIQLGYLEETTDLLSERIIVNIEENEDGEMQERRKNG